MKHFFGLHGNTVQADSLQARNQFHVQSICSYPNFFRVAGQIFAE